MILANPQRTGFATWAMRIALFAAQLILLALLLHRFTTFPTPVALNLVVLGMAGALLALLIAILAFIRIWNHGMPGTGRAVVGAIVALAILAWPAALLPTALKLPAINDVTTDASRPPPFIALAQYRHADANPSQYPGGSFALAQASAYPDIKPLEVARSKGEAFGIARSVVTRMGWSIVAEQPPNQATNVGLIEAVDETLILGFDDDIVIRVVGDKGRSRIDVRSASRYGRHDLGRNAERVRGVLKQLHARLSLGDTGAEDEDDPTTANVKPAKKTRSKKRARQRARAPAQSGTQRARKRKARRRVKRRRQSWGTNSRVFQRQ